MSGTASRVWSVRLLVAGAVSAGTPVTGFEIRASRYERCDTAEIALAVDQTALGGATPWFAAETASGLDISVQVLRADRPGASWVTLFRGVADAVVWRPEDGRAVVACRDYLSRLLDLRVQEAWLNFTAPELVAAMASAAGLGASVDFGAAAGMTGQFWQIEHKRMAVLAQHRFQTAFDLAFFLAREACCDLYADGTVLTASPMLAPDDGTAVVHDLSGLAMAHDVRRDLTATQGLVVHVASWDGRQRSRSEIFYDGSGFSATAPGSGLVHSFRVPGRRLDEVKSIARWKYARIAAHRLEARVRIPGNEALRPRHFARGVVSGVSAFPGILAVDEVVSRMKPEEGFVQEVVLRDRMGGLA
ncbi:hypothetical protein [Acidomonas methanolica]|uniref:Phage protein n=1 Tax=Acidomonas methanolica NBRC 104435 TaxID=1231351 RepID=A0A023D2M4_ACIMT|nr:hypothetical protein [Acidomonas methanolica]MBU2654262.1 hypothetical protein [Acidomonas methanolica]TCS29300.1 hypothetical protein EDC31_10772 [Acidomonas methanolica]GAJ28015.1 hypothetical protein Amme_012_004 [Acidomonas methanolica NBRC 104435]GEK99321.1 hypothetical protein AME01nite_18200 [Acidomonas methanolica NBRC 104435]